MRLKTLTLREYTELPLNSVLEVGDVVVSKNRFGKTSIFEIDSLTKTLAKCDCGNFIARFPITFNFQFQSLPRNTWNTTTYRAFRRKGNVNE